MWTSPTAQIRKLDRADSGTYFLLFLRLSRPPVESNKEASKVAGFLDARKAEMRRYFAEVDI